MRFIALFVLVFLLPFPLHAGDAPRNIILLIGDGMGLAQISAARKIRKDLSITQIKQIALMSTDSADDYVTDSAASATAMAGGVKTNNGFIGLDPNKKRLKNIFEIAKEKGLQTAVIATSRITHATPAAFVAHVDSREKELDIALQLSQSSVDLLLGGGADMFLPHKGLGGKRNDGRNLLQKQGNDKLITRSVHQYLSSDRLPQLALIETDDLPRARNRHYSLGQLLQKALSLLEKEKRGFLIMIEGSQIDWGGHKKDLDYVIEEMLDFDSAVNIALQYAKKDPHTLVLVTGDHETGGLSLLAYDKSVNRFNGYSFASRHHSGTLIPLFSFGPGSEQFQGLMENSTLGKHLVDIISSQKTK
ncbi:MAG: alkaline phosphatase [Gammaproteobacteria bacterium]|nr:alkaline phosphatase [Gammaproteobacteria bacterium]MDH5693353.1 alkaline phosphatase [Gammaproteobacteria bacterium]